MTNQNGNTIVLAPIQPEFMPKQAHETDAGFDVFSRVRVVIAPHSIENVPVGVKVAMPKGKVCLVFPRSSLPLKKGLMLSNSAGIIDSGYRGEIHMQLYNLNDEPVLIDRGEKIGQLLFVSYTDNSGGNFFQENKHYDNFEDMYPSDRGTNGFGSTGN